MPVIYPPAPPSISGDFVTASRFLANPTLVTRRLRTIAQQRYIADRLLTGRYEVQGGAVLYETGESMFTARDPEAVGALSKYPRTSMTEAAASLAATKKWGEDTPVSDENIKRRGTQGMDVVDKVMQKQVNTNVRLVDSLAISAISSAVTATIAAGAAWSGATAKQILDDVLQAAAAIRGLNQGFEADVVALDDSHWAYALSAFVAANWLPREALTENPALTGNFPVVGGLLFLPTPNVIAASTVLVADSTQLGGMADENLGGPGYGRVSGDAPGVEGKTIRMEEADGWLIRCRRVTVPIVQEPAAAKKITGA